MSATITVTLTEEEAIEVINGRFNRSPGSAEAKLIGVLECGVNAAGLGHRLTSRPDMEGAGIRAEQIAAVKRGVAHSHVLDFYDSEAAAIIDEVAATMHNAAATERVAEAVHYAQGFDDYGVANDDERQDAEDIARAAIAALLGGARQ